MSLILLSKTFLDNLFIIGLKIGSSIESHISHLIASFSSAHPKDFSTLRIKKYLKINDYKNNNINIFKLYLSTYSNKEDMTIDENTYDYEIFTADKVHNIPILNYLHFKHHHFL